MQVLRKQYCSSLNTTSTYRIKRYALESLVLYFDTHTVTEFKLCLVYSFTDL